MCRTDHVLFDRVSPGPNHCLAQGKCSVSVWQIEMSWIKVNACCRNTAISQKKHS